MTTRPEQEPTTTDTVTIPVVEHGARLVPMLAIDADTIGHAMLARAAALTPPGAHRAAPHGRNGENRGYRVLQTIADHPGTPIPYDDLTIAHAYLTEAVGEFDILAVRCGIAARREASTSSIHEATLLAARDVHERSAFIAREATAQVEKILRAWQACRISNAVTDGDR